MAARAPKGEVVRNPVSGGFTYALRFTAYGKRHYRTLGRPEDGWTESKAEDELRVALREVRQGEWNPQKLAAPPPQEPTFHEFASAWFDQEIKHVLRPNTVLDYEWQLVHHLLPFFKDHLLSQIAVAEVDRYRESKVSENRVIEAAANRGKPRMLTYTDKTGKTYKRPERPLSATSINKTITRLGQVLELALERGLIESNPARVGGKRRKLKASHPDGVYLDRAEQMEALLAAAGRIDAESRPDHRIPRRAMLATLTFAGLRISELLDLEWRDVDLAGGRLRVRKSKTDAGVRYVNVEPVLMRELEAHKAAQVGQVGNVLSLDAHRTGKRTANVAGLVFPSAVGTRQDRNRVRGRVLAAAIKGANERLTDEGLAALPDGLTLHALRRTFCSVLVALGYDTAYVIREAGHTDPAVLYGRYAKAIRPEDRERIRLLVKCGREGDYLAVAGSGSESDGRGEPVGDVKTSINSAI